MSCARTALRFQTPISACVQRRSSSCRARNCPPRLHFWRRSRSTKTRSESSATSILVAYRRRRSPEVVALRVFAARLALPDRAGHFRRGRRMVRAADLRFSVAVGGNGHGAVICRPNAQRRERRDRAVEAHLGGRGSSPRAIDIQKTSSSCSVRKPASRCAKAGRFRS